MAAKLMQWFARDTTGCIVTVTWFPHRKGRHGGHVVVRPYTPASGFSLTPKIGQG